MTNRRKMRRGGCPQLQTYELLKRQWILDHPAATPAAYTQAMQQIARKCGV